MRLTSQTILTPGETINGRFAKRGNGSSFKRSRRKSRITEDGVSSRNGDGVAAEDEVGVEEEAVGAVEAVAGVEAEAEAGAGAAEVIADMAKTGRERRPI